MADRKHAMQLRQLAANLCDEIEQVGRCFEEIGRAVAASDAQPEVTVVLDSLPARCGVGWVGVDAAMAKWEELALRIQGVE